MTGTGRTGAGMTFAGCGDRFAACRLWLGSGFRFVSCLELLRRSSAIFAFDPILMIVPASTSATDSDANRTADCF